MWRLPLWRMNIVDGATPVERLDQARPLRHSRLHGKRRWKKKLVSARTIWSQRKHLQSQQHNRPQLLSPEYTLCRWSHQMILGASVHDAGSADTKLFASTQQHEQQPASLWEVDTSRRSFLWFFSDRRSYLTRNTRDAYSAKLLDAQCWVAQQASCALFN